MEEGVALIAQVALSFMVECEKELLLFSDSLLGMMLSLLCIINNKEALSILIELKGQVVKVLYSAYLYGRAFFSFSSS